MTKKLLDVVVIGRASKITLPGLARLYAYIWIASSNHVIIVFFFLIGCMVVILCCMLYASKHQKSISLYVYTIISFVCNYYLEGTIIMVYA